MSESSSSTDSSASGTRATATSRHASYYLRDDPMAVFLVEDHLFKVHRHFFSEGSKVFRDMFTCPVGDGMGPEGMDDERPISLPEVTVKEFETLLDHFHQPSHLKSERSKEQHLQISIDSLSISHPLIFDEVFQYVLKDLRSVIKDIPAIKIFFIGEKYNLKDWLLAAYEALLDRETPLTVQEVEALGPDKVVQYMHAREAIHEARLEKVQKMLYKEQHKEDCYSWRIKVPEPGTTRSYVEKYFCSRSDHDG